MKDAYSFDRDEPGLDVAFRRNEEAYHRMFERAGLEVLVRGRRVGDDGRQGIEGLPRALGIG